MNIKHINERLEKFLEVYRPEESIIAYVSQLIDITKRDGEYNGDSGSYKLTLFDPLFINVYDDMGRNPKFTKIEALGYNRFGRFYLIDDKSMTIDFSINDTTIFFGKVIHPEDWKKLIQSAGGSVKEKAQWIVQDEHGDQEYFDSKEEAMEYYYNNSSEDNHLDVIKPNGQLL